METTELILMGVCIYTNTGLVGIFTLSELNYHRHVCCTVCISYMQQMEQVGKQYNGITSFEENWLKITVVCYCLILICVCPELLQQLVDMLLCR